MSVGVCDRSLMKMLLHQNAEIKQQLMLNTWLLQELVKKHYKVSEVLTAGKLPDHVQLPLKSQDDVHLAGAAAYQSGYLQTVGK